uniref:Uncharacterized protein n=1 Tax=Quercus lobata TaxID=97700 RepID=A0A7N2L613_QUELO
MARALLSAIVEQLGPFISSEFTLTATVKQEVQKLETKFCTIQAVLNDAEKRQLKEEAVKLWLDKLKRVSYEMYDVLDEWNTAMIKEEIEKQQKVEEKAQTSTAQKRKREVYGFELSKAIEEVVERPKTTSYVDVSDILGREKVKDDLVSIILGEGTEKQKRPHVISLVGMGGMGKTTFAQLAFNHHEVKDHFEKRIWVCVSEPFDQCRVAKAIVEALGVHDSNTTELQSLLDTICELIRGKKIFLIFDDVWTEDYAMWKPFRDALKNCGSQSSRILVTTRKDKVAKMMESANTIKLEELSEEDCWLVFSKIAFVDEDPKQCEQLEDVGKKISKKCKGLPLAAKTLGSLMHFKKSREEWNNVLDSNFWELEDIERGLFAPLLLSYYDLPSPLKRCFSYCAIFPKDHVFEVDMLVSMWIAHGFVESKGNMEVEIMAREYFKSLVIRSFFQKEHIFFDMRYKMHDIVHDFAQSITKNECLIISSDIESKLDFNSARHLGLEIRNVSQFPLSIDSAKNLRTLIIFNQVGYDIPNLQNFRLLRVLTLINTMELPHTVENLIHLRYLTLFGGIEVLSETICNLCNLQYLKITKDFGSVYTKLPQGIGKLINLRHLIGEDFLIPRGIGRLISLRTLKCFSISDEDSEGCKLGELKNLNHLQGSFEIRGLGNVIDVSEAENAQLKKKIQLREMILSFKKGKDRGWWDDPVPNAVDPNDRRMERDVLVLNALEPPQDLEQLDIRWYQGTTMSPNWLMSLTKLKLVSIFSATKLTSLPPLGKFPFLESLTIRNVCSLKQVGVEFLGIESENKKEDIKIFPNLKYLRFVWLEELEEWIGIGGKEDADCITVMPRLQRLEIHGCGKLKSLPDFLRTIPLNKLEIAGCPIIKERCQRETGEDWRTISHIPIIDLQEHSYYL